MERHHISWIVFDLDYIKQFDVVHSGNYCFTESELGKIKATGVKVAFDFSDDSTEEYYKKVLPDVNYAFCSFDGNEEELKAHLQMMIDGGADSQLLLEEQKVVFFMMEKHFTDSRQFRLKK